MERTEPQKLVASLPSLPNSAPQGSLSELPAGETTALQRLVSLVLISSLTKADFPALRPLLWGLPCKLLFPLLPSLTLVMLRIPLPLVFALSNHCEDCYCATVAHGLAFAGRLSLGLLCSSTVWEDPCYISEHALQPSTLLHVVILGHSPEYMWTLYDPKSFRCSELDVCL